MKKVHPLAPTYLLVIAAVLQIVWGLVPSASRLVLDEIPVELFIAIRWTISGGIFGLFLGLTRTWKKLAFRKVGAVALLGIFGYGLASLGTLYGLKIGGVTNFALLSALSPAVTSLVSIWILKELPSRLFLLALPIGVLGLLLLLIGKYQVSSFSVAGLSAACVLAGYFLEALVFVYSKKFKSEMGTAQYLATTQIATALFMWGLQFTTFNQLQSLQGMTLQGMTLQGALAAGFVSIVACVLCYAVLYWLLNHIDGHKLALFDGFHTLSAVIFGYLLFHEELKPLMLVGGILIISALVVGNLPRATMEEF